MEQNIYGLEILNLYANVAQTVRPIKCIIVQLLNHDNLRSA